MPATGFPWALKYDQYRQEGTALLEIVILEPEMLAKIIAFAKTYVGAELEF